MRLKYTKMSYIASTIAGYFIEKSNKEEQPLSVLRLIKLVYISHGWNLALYDSPLISDRIEAWKYGPSIPSLHDLFKGMGLKKDDLVNSTVGEVSCIREEHIRLLSKVYVKYEKITGEQLSDLMHEKDTPWHTVWDNEKGRDKIIENEAIKLYYSKQINKDSFDALPTTSPITSKKKAETFLKKAGILLDNGELHPFYINS